MAKLPADELRRVLSERVTRRVAGAGIPRRAVDDAVGRVVDALKVAGEVPIAGSSAARPPVVFAALSARSVPDLASRVRSDLERDGTVLEDMGIGTAGQHTVVVVRVPAASRAALERLADRARYGLSFVNIDAGASTA